MIKATFEKERETKNTVRFLERESTEPPVIGTLYLQKYALKRLGDPKVVVVTVDAEAEASPQS